MNQHETNCQIYLIVPPVEDRKVAMNFAECGSMGTIACALLRCGQDGRVDRAFANLLLNYAHAANIPLLLENDAAAAAELDADGVHIMADEERYTEARGLVGDEAIVGADCGLSRHAGLTLAEMGADYVSFSDAAAEAPCDMRANLEELIGWWSEVTVVPCIAWDMKMPEMAYRLAAAGADFVAVSDPAWSHPKGQARAMSELHAGLNRQRISA